MTAAARHSARSGGNGALSCFARVTAVNFCELTTGPKKADITGQAVICSMMYGTYVSVDHSSTRSSRKLPHVLFAALAVVVCVALVTLHLEEPPAFLEQRPRPLNFFTRDELHQINHKLLPTMRVRASTRKSRLSWRLENHPDPMEHKDMPLLAGVDLPTKPNTVQYDQPQVADFDGDTAPSVGDPLGVKLPTQLTEVGHEKRGSFYIRLDQLKPTDDERDDEGLSEDSTTYIHIYGRVNHHIVCTLRGYRRLDARFDGQPIIGTGFKMVYDGHSQLQSGPLPAGNPGEFDVITCQDLDSGELQQFKLAYD